MPSSTIRSISITVSDDDGAAAPRRARAGRRKVVRSLGQRAVRLVARWWPILLLLPAVALLLFEASRLRASPSPAPPVSSSLGCLDLTTRLVHGVREPCLKFLSPKSIENLAFHEGSGLDAVVKRIIYKTDDDDYDSHHLRQLTYLLQHAEATRFNLFTGFQTVSEREESFKVNETVNVHCGFYSDNGGFKISDDDVRYMRTCKVVVSTMHSVVGMIYINLLEWSILLLERSAMWLSGMRSRYQLKKLKEN
ncbi:hypothetical protein ZWY2020_004987 [Hordeum vulgare]|nr:hypothetical protein ZWY2020_004987 [Hordeum vulgare]